MNAEVRDRAIRYMTRVLTGSDNPWTLVGTEILPHGQIGKHDELTWRATRALDNLAGTARDVKQYGERMTRDIEQAMKFVSGEQASFNSLGVLQGSAPRFDGLCMLFNDRTEVAIQALCDLIVAVDNYEYPNPDDDESVPFEQQPHLRD